MKKAGDVRTGNLLLIGNEIYKVEEVEQKGAAKAHKQIGLKMKSVPEGKFKELTIAPEDKVDEAEVIRKKALYSYTDDDFFYFLDAESYESYQITKGFIGRKECFLRENQEIDISFYNGQPVEALFPNRMRLKVTTTAKGMTGGQDATTFKKAELENGLEVDVPQFVEENDIVEIDTDTFEYMDRIQEK